MGLGDIKSRFDVLIKTKVTNFHLPFSLSLLLQQRLNWSSTAAAAILRLQGVMYDRKTKKKKKKKEKRGENYYKKKKKKKVSRGVSVVHWLVKFQHYYNITN